MDSIIKAIESKGYIVKACENMEMGVLNQNCPVVYKILNPDYSSVYGANGISPDSLAKWVNLPAVKAPVTDRETISPVKDANRAKMERDYDNLYNEGAEGYNPYRN